MKSEEIKWQVYEYPFKPKSADWYWVVWSISIFFIILCVFFKNLILGILIFLSAFIMSLFSAKEPDLINVKINSSGIFLNNKFYAFNQIYSFWINKQEIIKEQEVIKTEYNLLLKLKSKISPLLVVPIDFKNLENLNEDKLEKFLKQYLKIEQLQEPALHKIIEKLF
jgi:hypothetical protein